MRSTLQRATVAAGTLAFSLLAAGCGGGHAAVSTTTSNTSTTTTATSTNTSVGPRGENVALNVPVRGSGGFNYTQGSYLEGFEFTAKRAIAVTRLGAYDANLSALDSGTESFATVPVSLYDVSTHTMLAHAKVAATDPAIGVYRYVTLTVPVDLNTKDDYAVVWVSLSNFYVASPQLTMADVNSAINYVAMVGNGAGGLTTTRTMLEPNWFYTVSEHGVAALNYDLGPNFAFTAAA
jgi:hypothetical protein